MVPNARRQSFATECAPNDPRLEGTKTTAELHPVIHVIDFSADWVAEMHVLGDQSKEPAQTSDIAQVERTEIKRNKKHFVRINHDGIGFAPARGHPFAFRQKRESSAVCAVDMQPHFVFAAYLRNLENWIDTRC